MHLIQTFLISCFICSISWAHTGSAHKKLIPATEKPKDVSIFKTEVVGKKRIFISNGIPNHDVAPFPNNGNPHAISAQNYRLQIATNPSIEEQPIPMIRQPFGIALNGVLFDPGTAEYYKRQQHSEWNYEALSSGTRPLGLDENHAHVQPNGAYHYHGLPTALFEALEADDQSMTLLGWAADGFPIYGLYGHETADDLSSKCVKLKSSYHIKKGNRPSGKDAPGGRYDGSFTLDYEYVAGSGDLDECGGRIGVTPEFPDGTYYYVLTDDYPFIPRMFRGKPDPSFNQRGPDQRHPPRNHQDHRHRGPSHTQF
ncbi:MAG: YHYH protein [Opitutaceae bacterium]